MNKKIIKYLRLSIADEAVSKGRQDESDSIENQRKLLDNYISYHPELNGMVEEIIDDGFSGTSLNRPALQRLLSMVEQNQVGAIVMKDLSRLGRNYLEVGYLLDLVFPRFLVRTIAVNDGYDSLNVGEYTGGIELALRNLKNDFYSRDLSVKVKSARDVLLTQGHHMGGIPFGYQKLSKDTDIQIDPEAAEIVRLVFQMAAYQRMSPSDIAREMNKREIITPSKYRQLKGGRYKRVQSIWMPATVRNILWNLTYTGSFAKYQGHYHTVGHGPYTSIPREEWEIIENALPPIITKETYDLAWSSIKHSNRRTGRKEKSPPKHSVLSKKLYCGCCGMQMRLKKRKGLIYICPSAEFKPEGNQCELVQCSAAALEAVVLDTVNQLARLSAKQVNLAVQKQKSAEQKIASVERSIAKVRRKLSTIGQKRQELFEQMVSGAITPETFLQHKGSLRQQEQEQQAIVQALGEELVRMKLDLVESKEHSTETPVYEALETLTLDVVNRLIKKIVIYDNRSPEIIFNFKDCIRQ